MTLKSMMDKQTKIEPFHPQVVKSEPPYLSKTTKLKTHNYDGKGYAPMGPLYSKIS